MPQDDLELAPSASPAEDANSQAAEAASQAAQAAAEESQSEVNSEAEHSNEPASGDNTTSSAPEDSAKSLLDGVSDVLKKKAEPQTQEAEEAESQPEPEKAKPAGDKPQAEAAEDEGKDDHKLPFHKHPRFQQVIRQRREALKENEDLKRQLGGLKPLEAKAQQLDNIGNFLVTQQLSETEFIQGMEIMAAMKNDPLRAMEMLRPHIEALQKVTGEILPPDIQAKVESGEVDQATARELVQTRVKAAVAAQQNEKVVRQTEAQRAQSLAAANQNAVAGWEQKIRQSDPDYAAKEKLVIGQIRGLIAQHGMPPSPEHAVALAQKAYEEVSAALPKPKPVATRPAPSSSASLPANRQTQAKPSSLYDGVDGALRALRGGA